ncbi:MAG: hypothetical protein R3324_07945, partial [Halobacteriales archaeon]|nr:hypothetical protein [Halobacteriales archaeon]
NFGLRYDLQEGENEAATVAANPVFPDTLAAVDFAGNDGGFDWESISPRLGATYALGAERKTLLRASYARFAEQLSSGNISRVNPLGFAEADYTWNDANGNGVFDVGEAGQLVYFTGFDPANPGAAVSPNRNDPNLDPSVTDELLFGVEHAFLPEFVVGADVTYRLTSDVLETRTLVRDQNGVERTTVASDWIFDHTVVSDGVTVPHLPNGQQWSADYYALNPALQRTGGSLLTNGDREIEYLGAGINFTKRLANRWMARGYFQYGEAEWDVPASYNAIDNPADGVNAGDFFAPSGDGDGELFVVQSAGSGPFDNTFIQSTWSANLNGMYQFWPDQPYGFNLAVNLFAREGYAIPYTYESTLLTDGRQQQVVVTGDVDSFRNEDIFTTDLRLEKDMPFTENLSGTLSLDVFNVFNENYAMQRNIQLDTAEANFLVQTLSPRIYRLGFRISWR